MQADRLSTLGAVAKMRVIKQCAIYDDRVPPWLRELTTKTTFSICRA